MLCCWNLDLKWRSRFSYKVAGKTVLSGHSTAGLQCWNCSVYRLYTYGNFDVERHLELINEHALKHYSRLDVDTSVPLEKHWDTPVRFFLFQNFQHTWTTFINSKVWNYSESIFFNFTVLILGTVNNIFQMTFIGFFCCSRSMVNVVRIVCLLMTASVVIIS